MEVTVSIIIVSYNNFYLLEKCLNSIYKYTTGISFEIIIIDNNSTEERLSSILSKYKNVTLIQNSDNLGFAAANNQGIKIAKGKYCLLLNNDTVFIDDILGQLLGRTKDFGNNFVAGCQLLNSDMTKQESTTEFPNLWNTFTENFFLYRLFSKSKLFNKYYLNTINIYESCEVDIVKGAFFFAPKGLLLTVDGFDERFFFYSEETDLCYRLKKQFSSKILFYPDLKIIHHGGPEEDLRSWFHFKYVSIGKIKFFQKHSSLFRLFGFLVLHYGGILNRVLLNSILGFIKLNKKYIKKSGYYIRLLFLYPSNEFK